MFQDFQTPSYVGFWIRFLAYLVDSLLMAAVFLPLGMVIGVVIGLGGVDETSPEFPLAGILIRLVSIGVGWLYHGLLDSSAWQGTIGKKLLGIRITDLNGNRISFGRATGRYFGMILSGMICFIGFFMIAFTERKQGLHDMLAGTLVLTGAGVGEQYREPPPPPDFSHRGGTLGLG